jgi:hypothetical protein
MRNEPIEQFEHAGYVIKIFKDDEPPHPRHDYDNLGTMACFPGRYDLGDWLDPRSAFSEKFVSSAAGGPSADSRRFVHGSRAHAEEFLNWFDTHKKDIALHLPLYLYDHSGITMRCSDFREFDPGGFDSGMVGFIFVTKEKVREDYKCKLITKKVLAQVEACLRGEVDVYDKYLTEQFVGYVVETTDGTHVDSCWGFDDFDYCVEEAKASANGWREEEGLAEQAMAL